MSFEELESWGTKVNIQEVALWDKAKKWYKTFFGPKNVIMCASKGKIPKYFNKSFNEQDYEQLGTITSP